ncbi:MAG: hypothetical protein O2954_07580 [bacterium]|nr:hypothetical protein [bacterium]
MATIVDNGKRIPFMRGMLTHYLLEQGFSFREAYQVADRIRNSLQKQKTVSARKMMDLVHDQVRELFGERPIGDGIFWSPRSRQILVEDEQGTRPFSREHLSHSLVVTGVDEDQAYRISERIEADFIRQDKTVVKRRDILKSALNILGKESGESFAERYGIWNRFRNRENAQPLIILIGGATGVGKTSVAVALANLLRISRVASTDEIRQVMRLMIAQELMPALHSSSYAAWETVSIPPLEGADPVIYGFREQAARICVGVRATLERAVEENVSLIVDGVHLVPDLLQLDEYKDKALFIQVNLFLSDKQPFAERFEMRSQEASRRTQHRYLKYMEQILHIQQHLLEVGEANRVPAFENSDLDETVQSISLMIMDTLRKKMKNGSARWKS